MKTDVFQIGGMTCAACASRVERAILGVPGVASVDVDLASHRARVSWEGASAHEHLKAAVGRAGYVLADRDATDPDERIERQTRANLRLAGLLAVPLFVLGMSHERILSGWASSVPQALLSLGILVGPARDYFKRAYAALRERTFDMNSLVALGALTSFAYSIASLLLDGAHAAHGRDELAHDLGPLGIAEVHVVGDGERIGARAGEVAPRLDDGLLGAHLGVGGDVARSDVAGDRERFIPGSPKLGSEPVEQIETSGGQHDPSPLSRELPCERDELANARGPSREGRLETRAPRRPIRLASLGNDGLLDQERLSCRSRVAALHP